MMPDQNPTILKAERLCGKSLEFRDAKVHDAQFILSLRTNPSLNHFLSETSRELSDQKNFLDTYQRKSRGEAYFVIERKEKPVGTVRLYNQKDFSFSWGSWIIREGESPAVSIETVLMVYAYGCDFLGFNHAHFDVRKGNQSVWKFHENFGAKRVGETELDFLYEIDRPAIERARMKYKRFLPEGIRVLPIE